MARITIDGQTYDADAATIAQMAKDGVKYEPAKAEGGGFWQGAGDMMRGGAHGVTLGLADAKFGDDNQSLLQRAGLADYKDVKERSPVLTTVGDIGGSLVNPLGELGMAAKGASLAARVGRGALGSGVESLVREAADQGQQGPPLKALEAGGVGAGIGALIPGLGAGVNALGKTQFVKDAGEALGGLANKAADTARNKSFGLGAAQMKALGQKNGVHGDQLAADTAAELEKLVPSPGAQIDPRKPGFTFGGENASAKAGKLEAIEGQMGQGIGDSLNAAGIDDKVPGYWSGLQQRMQVDSMQLPKTTRPENALYNAANATSDELLNEAVPKTAADFHQRISKFGKDAYGADKANKQISTLENSASAQSAEMLRKHGRDELGALVNENAAPDVAAKFRDSMKGYSDVADYTRAANTRADVESANSNVMGVLAAPLAAIGGGAVSGAFAGGIPGAIAGAGAGAGMSINSGTRGALRQAFENSRGMDVAANTLRAVAPKLKSADSLVQGLGEALAKQGNRKGAVALEGDVAPAFVGPDMEDEERQRRAALGYGSR